MNFLLVLSLWLSLSMKNTSLLNLKHEGTFAIQTGVRILADVSTFLQISSTNRTAISCANACFKEPNCCGASFHSENMECVIDKSGCCNHTTEQHAYSEVIQRVSGDWFDWSIWSMCSLSCGGGVRTRIHRSDCRQTITDVEECHMFECDHYGHDAMHEVNVDGYEDYASYDYTLNYDIPFDHVVAIIDSSSSCRQLIQIICTGATMHQGLNTCVWGTYWTNRTTHNLSGTKPPSPFFHGSDPEQCVCACGLTQTCQRPELYCNCDTNDATWQEDTGYVTSKESLPIVAIYVGDTGGADEHVRYFIGPVECT